MDDASKAMQSWQVIELIAETNAVKLEHNKLVDQFNLQGLQMLELQKQHIRINKTVEEVTTAFMRFQGQVGMARGVPPILLRVSDRGHFGTSVVTPPRRRRSPLLHGSAAFLPEEPEETEEEKIALLEEEIESLKAMHFQATEAADQAKSAVKQNAQVLQKRLSEKSALLSKLDQAKMQETVNSALSTLKSIHLTSSERQPIVVEQILLGNLFEANVPMNQRQHEYVCTEMHAS